MFVIHVFGSAFMPYLLTGLLVSVIGDSDISSIFGNNVDTAQAWSKLFELENCPMPEVLPGTIIMVNESVAAGAKFMLKPNATSRFECEFECCYKQHKGCNVAIYSADQKAGCYLFNCGTPSKCKFDQHNGYSVSIIAKEISSEADLLETTRKTAPVSTTNIPPKQQHLLDGCRPGVDKCVTDNTECSSTGFCRCKEGFHPKNGVCRQDCLEGLQFECTNGDAKYGQPDCIAIYDVCDGTPQCPDASDEHCSNDEESDWSNVGDINALKAALKAYIDAQAKSSTTIAPSSATAKSAFINEKVKETTRVTNAKQTVPVANATAQAGSRSTSPPSIPQPSANESFVGLDINEEVVPEKYNFISTSSASAVVALALTVTLTLILFGYLGCRYRRTRRRVVRPGKAVNGSEVDYLIDGMYL